MGTPTMKLAVLFLLVVTLLSITDGKKSFKKSKETSSSEESSKNKSHYQLFSTVTAYDTVRGDIKKQPGCEPKALWAFVRHGTRFPHDKEMQRYRKLKSVRDAALSNHQNGEGQLSEYQLKLLRKWEFKGTDEEEMHLTTSGYKELLNLGKRLQKAFPELLNKNEPHSVNILRTSAERNIESAAALTQGLFGIARIIPESAVNDQLIKTGKYCPFWKNFTKSPEIKKHAEEFKNSSEMQTLIRNVNRRLGYESEPLTFDTIKDIYDVCGFETSWYHGEYSPWCSVFSTEELKVMEYLEDLSYYWKSGYGNKYTPKLGCAKIKEMITKFDNSVNLPKTNIYFGHSSGSRELIVSLGIGKCRKDLEGKGYVSPAARNNCWRTSQLTPFSANLIAVLYSCKTKSEKTSKIGVYVNEKIVKLPFCNGQELCDFDTFKNSQSALIDKSYCNKDFCMSSFLRSRDVHNLADDDDEDEFDE